MKYNPADYNYIRGHNIDDVCITFGGRIIETKNVKPGAYSGSVSVKFLIDDNGGW